MDKQPQAKGNEMKETALEQAIRLRKEQEKRVKRWVVDRRAEVTGPPDFIGWKMWWTHRQPERRK